MDVCELRPRPVIDEEDDQVQVLSNSNVQVDTNQASTSGSHDNCKIKWLVHHVNPMIKQVQAMFQYSNQLLLQRIIHWTLSLEIFLEVYKQDQYWLHFVSISHLCHP